MMTVRSISGWPVRGSVELREFVQHAGHFVAALAAADIDDDVGVAALGQRFEQDRLAGAEAARQSRAAAPRDREQASMMRWPVIIGSSAASRALTGLATRTGQYWWNPTSTTPDSGVRMRHSVSSAA